MSLPAEVQEELVHALPGLEAAVVMRPGYAVEYDFVQPTELKQTLETKRLRRAVSRRSDQRNLRLRRGGGAGSRGRNQCGRWSRGGNGRSSSARDDELHRHDDRRPDDQGMPRAVSHVHVARRASAAAPDRQRGPPSDARRSRGRPGRRRAMGAILPAAGSLRAETARRPALGRHDCLTGERIPAPRALEAARCPAGGVGRGRSAARWTSKSCSADIDLASVETAFKYEGYLKRQEQSVERQRRQEVAADSCRRLRSKAFLAFRARWSSGCPRIRPPRSARHRGFLALRRPPLPSSPPIWIVRAAGPQFDRLPPCVRRMSGVDWSAAAAKTNVFIADPLAERISGLLRAARALESEDQPHIDRERRRGHRSAASRAAGRLAAMFPQRPDLLMDVGSGGGSPAIPLKLAVPRLSLTMVEAKAQKVGVPPRSRSGIWGWKTRQVETARYEELLARPELHEAHDIVSPSGSPN